MVAPLLFIFVLFLNIVEPAFVLNMDEIFVYVKQSPIRFLFFRENDIQIILFIWILFQLFLHWWPSLGYVKKNTNVDNKGNIPSIFAFKWFSVFRQFDNTFPIRF
jgi:hypothetical protein